MKGSKNWLPEEDRALLELHVTRGFQSWSKISKMLAQQFKIPNKTPKNCRERYNNHLNPSINRNEWTQQEEATLIDLHNEMGNRWAEISRHLHGRTDNSVKNKFYSKYRRAIRNLNHLLNHSRNIKLKELKINFVYKVINFLEKKCESDSRHQIELVKMAKFIKNEIITFEYMDINKVENQQILKTKFEELMTSVQRFNSNFKRKPAKKKLSRNSKMEQQSPNQVLQPLPIQDQKPIKIEHATQIIQQKEKETQLLTAVPNLVLLHSERKAQSNLSLSLLFNGFYEEQPDIFWNVQNCESSYSF